MRGNTGNYVFLRETILGKWRRGPTERLEVGQAASWEHAHGSWHLAVTFAELRTRMRRTGRVPKGSPEIPHRGEIRMVRTIKAGLALAALAAAFSLQPS